jgi:hypothetical protein
LQVVVTHKRSGGEMQGKSMLSPPESKLSPPESMLSLPESMFAGEGPPHAVSVKATPRQCARADLSRNAANVSTRERMPQSCRSVNASRQQANMVDIRVIEGDRVRLESSLYDLTRARIVYRLTGAEST